MPEFNITRDIRFHLSHVSLNGYKSIEDLECDIQSGLNILIGKNGAGKSNFLEFITSINKTLLTVESQTFKNAELTFIGTDGQHFKYGVSKLNHKQIDEEALLSYRQFLEINNELEYDNTDENLAFVPYSRNRKVTPRNMSMLFSRLKISYPSAIYIGFGFPEKILGLSEPMSYNISKDYDDGCEIPDTGINLLSNALIEVYNNINYLYDEQYDDEGEINVKTYAQLLDNLNAENFINYAVLDIETLKNLKKFSPIQDIRINKNVTIYSLDSEIMIDNIKLEFFVNDSWLPWSQLSDGTKRIFLIISEISEKPRSLVLLEEPELGIHPHQFDLVMQFLKEQSRFQQIIISTHSPKALDVLEPNELNRIMVASYKKGEGTKINHLNQVQVEKAIGYMHEVGYLSDYWLMSDLES